MSCKYCFATFQDFKVNKQLTLEESKLIVDKLHAYGIEKITFAGGEPMLYKELNNLIWYTKSLGITTSIITNGSLVSFEFLSSMTGHLDWFGLSIDSVYTNTNIKIGRVYGRHQFPILMNSYKMLINMARSCNCKIKINTVVNAHNQTESMQKFITWVNPNRWKIFDALRVKGQNDKHWEEVKSTRFDEFVSRHSHPNMVVEDNRLMTSSYILIDPLGRVFDDTLGKHTYSDSLLTSSMENCMKQVNISEELFLERGGKYNW